MTGASSQLGGGDRSSNIRKFPDRRQGTVRDASPRARSKHILLVEDHEMSRRLLDDVLRFHGYDISQTGDPLHAFAMLQEHIPDLIIMDIQLPHISGLELTRWIKEDIRLSGIPIVAVTAFAMEGDKQKILAGGCDAYIAKPFNVEDFLHIIAEFIG